MGKFIKFLVLVLFVSSCASGKVDSTTDDGKPRYEKIAERKIKGEVNYVKSPNGDYMLCIKTNDPTKLRGTNLVFIVYDLKKDAIALEKKVGEGSVKWFDDTHVEVMRIPGTVLEGQDPADFSTIYSVVDGSSRPKSRN